MSDNLGYLGLKDSNGPKDILLVRKPPKKEYWESTYSAYNGKIIGISSNRLFPLDHPHIVERTSAWLHCFRNPSSIIPSHLPIDLISESDFVDTKIKSLVPKKRKYDIAYSCFFTQQKTKNFDLMVECLSHMTHLKVHLMLHKFPKEYINKIRSIYPKSSFAFTLKSLPHKMFLSELAKARVCFLPNKIDASPRVLTESLCLNMSVLVNEDIVGGWKYVNDVTGSFFNISNIDKALEKCLSIAENPKCNEWFGDNYHINAQKKLSSFVYSNFKIKSSHLRPFKIKVPQDLPI